MFQYQGNNGWQPLKYPGLCEKLLAKSQTVAGFFLIHYAHLWQEHLDKLFDLYSTGNLKVHSILLAHPLVSHYVAVDPKRFNGLDSVADAVEHLHSGKSFGKVVVCVDPQFSKTMAKL
ncbi:hypothetical protein ZIOFF_035255 [Zingiber officinale]|uniref:Uncharacterized protein n=1 Tax=Zingiber officinale TaxID=94328 RepID=A0A8J5GBP8_ZINOF|nr:hypothetical protein ZIOFF_035255 [Zingiber officinale]